MSEVSKKIELQLGDILKINYPTNELLDNQVFFIDYLDTEKVYLVNVDNLKKIRIPISNGILGNGDITQITILSRSPSPGYAEQNGLLPGKWIDIYFGGELPFVITGEVTNLEKDMIEIKSTDGTILYLNFDYKGIPEDLSIQSIEIREKPAHLETLETEDTDPNMQPYQADASVPIKNKIQQFIIRADQIQFGKETLDTVVQHVNISGKQQRYSLETQLADLFDEMLSTIPTSQKTPTVLNNIHTMIERFRQLREHFSTFDAYGNVEHFITKKATYKPLSQYLTHFDSVLYWILPVVKNVKKIYMENPDTEDDVEDVHLLADDELLEMQNVIDAYKSNHIPSEQNKYAEYYATLTPYFTPFDRQTAMHNVPTQVDIQAIVDNYGNMYSTTYHKNNMEQSRFVSQKYNTAWTRLATEYVGAKQSYNKRVNVAENDVLNIRSILTLPETVVRFSKVALPGTTLLEKSQLNLSFFESWRLLTERTMIQPSQRIQLNDQLYNHSWTMEDGMDYAAFVETILPKTRYLFRQMKKYIHDKLSIVDVVSYLEPFLIYPDDLTFMQYKEIVQFIDEQISNHHRHFVEHSKLYMTLKHQLHPRKKGSDLFSLLVANNMEQYVNNGGYYIKKSDISVDSNSEILCKMNTFDGLRLFTSVISMQNVPLTLPNELHMEELVKTTTKTTTKPCETIVLAKYYSSLDKLQADNDLDVIYFDKKYDTTNYNLLETLYEKEVMTLLPEALKQHIEKDMMQKKMSKEDAAYLADTLVDGHKRVKDGQYAILYKGFQENAEDEIAYYVRKNRKWELAKELQKLSVNALDASILCDLQAQCLTAPTNADKCITMDENQATLREQLIQKMMQEFDMHYKMTTEQWKQKIRNLVEYSEYRNEVLAKLQEQFVLQYNSQKRRLGDKVDEKLLQQTVSPYQSLLSLILSQTDFVKKQRDILLFKNAYTRSALSSEDEHWLYCIRSNTRILPTFVVELAVAFQNGYDVFRMCLEQLKTSIGKRSDDGDVWCDKHSGWTICPVDLDTEEGYNEEGFKNVSRSIVEEQIGTKLMETATGKKTSVRYDTYETKTVNNVVNALSIAMGINMEPQKEFIMNGVVYLLSNKLETENEYNKQVRERAEAGKKMLNYRDFYNTSLLYFTFGMYLVAVQTSMPSVKTRKTHPGCIRSFTGYPLDGPGGDMSSLTYLGCVVYDVRGSGEPWNVLKGKKRDVIIAKIKVYLDEMVLPLPAVIKQIQEKNVYLLTAPEGEIPSEHALSQWMHFLPPLVPFVLKKENVMNVTTDFKKSFLHDVKVGSSNQREKIRVIQSKMFFMSLGIIGNIQHLVNKKDVLRRSMSGEPFLENACCNSSPQDVTIAYFSQQLPEITQYNTQVTQLGNILEDIHWFTKSGIFCSTLNTKNKYPSIISDFGEKTVYLAFLSFCNFNKVLPIPYYLQPICDNKPANMLLQPGDSNERLIQRMKEAGKKYTNDNLLQLLQAIGKHNIRPMQLNVPMPSALGVFLQHLEKAPHQDAELEPFCHRMRTALDTFQIANVQTTAEVRAVNNYLVGKIEDMRETVVEFIQTHATANVTKKTLNKTINIIKQLSQDIPDGHDFYSRIAFLKNSIHVVARVFPAMVIHNVSYKKLSIPRHYGFSKAHQLNLIKYVQNYYEGLSSFYGSAELDNLLKETQSSLYFLVQLSEVTPCFTDITKGDTVLHPVINEYTGKKIFDYYLLQCFMRYIQLTDQVTATEKNKRLKENDFIYPEVPEEEENALLLHGYRRALKEKTVELLVAYLEIIYQEKKIVDISYETIQQNVFKLKMREKNLITDKLKQMNEEEREMDTMMKIVKLGVYSKGMQKGLTVLDKDYYDEEEDFRKEMLNAERNIRRKGDMDDMEEVDDVLVDEYLEEQRVNEEIDNEVYDMEYINDDYMDGNFDGTGAPEEEYDDYGDYDS